MSIKNDVEGFLGAGSSFSASFYLLTARKGLLAISKSKYYQNMLTKIKRRKVTVLVLN